mmetsp:Transcript_111117/g.192711  ORF Transcript_111117/g.192711 Transcript_111117/m.192711 type:complete len:223 (-) Transcript_111117:487-1155(-)
MDRRLALSNRATTQTLLLSAMFHSHTPTRLQCPAIPAMPHSTPSPWPPCPKPWSRPCRLISTSLKAPRATASPSIASQRRRPFRPTPPKLPLRLRCSRPTRPLREGTSGSDPLVGTLAPKKSGRVARRTGRRTRWVKVGCVRRTDLPEVPGSDVERTRRGTRTTVDKIPEHRGQERWEVQTLHNPPPQHTRGPHGPPLEPTVSVCPYLVRPSTPFGCCTLRS